MLPLTHGASLGKHRTPFRFLPVTTTQGRVKEKKKEKKKTKEEKEEAFFKSICGR